MASAVRYEKKVLTTGTVLQIFSSSANFHGQKRVWDIVKMVIHFHRPVQILIIRKKGMGLRSIEVAVPDAQHC